MDAFLVSVIVPVYNCEHYIDKAIASALQQPEVCEVVVVNDGSTDGSETIIKQLQTQNPKIKLYHHPNKINKGRSATRNLGIQNAIGNYIAFLDADDFYLEKRFKNDQLIFEKNQEVDGVYNAIGVHFYRDATSEEREKQRLTTLKKTIEPNELFEALLYGKYGHFSILGLTIKKAIFKKVGLFNEVLQVAEDTELFFRMSLICNLFSGILNEPLAVRGIHDNNVNNDKDLYNIYIPKMYEALFFWTKNTKVCGRKIDEILKLLWLLKYKQNPKLYQAVNYWQYLFFNNTKYLFSLLSIKYFPLVRLRQKLFPFLYKSRN
ncbi:glycosyltransferase family 2 protein [Mariniflexile jejuense]|uniref:Glycosyltransferase family 2 protein n=1 Tax=Mariniflexile jejuense TaxID=1173582 RepID=A0ABW3JJL2_9FLAO